MACCDREYYFNPELRARYCGGIDSDPPCPDTSVGNAVPDAVSMRPYLGWVDWAYQSAVDAVGPFLNPFVPTINPDPDPNPPGVPPADGTSTGTGSALAKTEHCACEDATGHDRSNRSLWLLIAAGLALWML